MAFTSFNLHPSLMKAIEEAKYTTPTPVQQQAIPPVMEGRDVMASAQTGTGKTAAFVLPALHKLLTTPARKGHGPRVLILTPTRELAEQIQQNIRTFAKFAGIRTGLIMGGVSYGPQYKMLSEPLDILIATPGRLIDHMESKRVDFSRVEMLVLDEADRMLDMGFRKPVEQVLAAFPARPQILLFSATFDEGVEAIAKRSLQNPVRIALAPAKMNHDSITQVVYAADDNEHKFALLAKLLDNRDIWQAIVFAATKRSADKLAERLEKLGHPSAAMHGDMRQNARKRTLEMLHKGKLRVLVATDVAARGIDVKKLSHVINYDMPQVAEDYTHRIGRTGRGGDVGIAISLIVPEDVAMLTLVEKISGKKFTFETLPGMEPLFGEEEFRRRAPKEVLRRGGKQQQRRGAPQGGNKSAGGFNKKPFRRDDNRRDAGPRREDTRFEGKRSAPSASGFVHREEEPKRSFRREEFSGDRSARPARRDEGGRSFAPRGDGPRREGSARPFHARGEGQSRREGGERSFSPRGDGPARREGATRPFTPRGDGQRPFNREGGRRPGKPNASRFR